MYRFIIVIASLMLCACSEVPTKPVAGQVSNTPLPSFTAAYDSFSCDQLYSEARRITDQMHDIAGVRDDDTQMERLEFIGGVLYWPVLFFVDGSSDSQAARAEYNQLKERLLSLSQWVISKECGAA
ncbi:MAG: hypothetical protein PSN46_03080 [Gammaproteobacteria bacterium]|nr:hypothetical protein [Gammaproteobacteria bacterium]